MKLNSKIKKVGLITSIILIIFIGVGKVFNIPVLSTGVNYITYPVEKGMLYIVKGVTNVTDRFKTVNELLAENKKYKDEISRLTYDKSILNEYKNENENLKVLLEMKNRYEEYKGVGANIIGRDYGNWNKIYKIDKGISQNVKDKSVILANGGLVGHVEKATSLSSKVISIIDSRSSVSAEVSRTGDIGIVKGDIEYAKSGLCILKMNAESEVMKGDQIITSYLSDIYPPGILIGTVEKVEVSNNNLVSYAYIKPVVDFDHLQQVLVIQNET